MTLLRATVYICHNGSTVPTLDDLLEAKRTAVEVHEEKQRSKQCALDALASARLKLETTWFAAVGGIALTHAAQDCSFHETIDAILDKRLSTTRDRKRLAAWRKGLPGTPEQANAMAAKTPTRQKTNRSQALDVDFDTVDADELLQNLTQLEADAERAQKQEADADAQVRKTTKDLRKMDNHWRIKVGEILLAHADADGNSDFRQSLDRILEQRIAEHHRPLLGQFWRSATAPPTAPPAATDAALPAATIAPPPADQDATTIVPRPAETVLPGWVPRKLPDKKTWGAALLKPAGKDLPPNLVGACIRVVPRTGDRRPWVTRITEVVETSEDSILVHTDGDRDFSSAENTPTTPHPAAGGDDAEVTGRASPPPETGT